MGGHREREFDVALPDVGDFIRVRFATEGGAVVRFSVQYETTIAGATIPVVRYDDHHEEPHRDILNRRGDVVDKHWLGMTSGEALELALADLQTNWSRYKRRFLEGRQ